MRLLTVAILALASSLASCDVETFAGVPILDLPAPGNEPLMARFIVNNANWTSFGYVSKKCNDGKATCPSNAVFAISDGNLGCGSGIPYFWGSRHHPSVAELIDGDSRGAAAMTLAQTDVCNEKGWDPQDPRCAHIIIYGKYVPLEPNSQDYQVAQTALFSRHPQLSYYPPGHNFFCAKLEISRIEIISKFGGPIDVDLKKYFDIKC